MILQALCDYYERAGLAPLGWEFKEIPFLIVIDRNGKFISLEDMRESGAKKARAKSILVPKAEIRSGKNAWERPNLLWDHYGFVLATPKEETDDAQTMALKQNGVFINRIRQIYSDIGESPELTALLNFYDSQQAKEVIKHPVWNDCVKIKGCNLTFRLADSPNLMLHGAEIQNYVSSKADCASNGNAEIESSTNGRQGVCLITGCFSEIERLHPSIAGVNEKPAPFAAVNNLENPAFSSFGKKQGFNFPISKVAAFRYATSLNHLLIRDHHQRIQVGDASTVFWSEKHTDLEDSFADLFDEPPKDDPAKQTRAIEALFKAPQSGALSDEGGNTRFYVLGLAPNAARISVRFWQVGTVAEMSARIRQHFEDLEIVHASYEKPYLSLFRLLVATAIQGKSENIPPNLAGEFMRAILAGLPYPQTLLQAAVRRIRAEREVNYPRAALIKACLNRQARYSPSQEKEIAVSLDDSNTNPGYRIGRLFAALEKIQEEAVNPGATIRDRFYGAASSTPVTVFSNLMKLKNHHLAKLEEGRKRYFEKLIGQIMSDINDFPAHLSLADQGRFAIGYYHQRQAFFTKSEPTSTTQGA
ncbi:MAG: type I-C CRISPR-associated protein Cas8c/Csd1 [Hydrogenophilales bacterium CG_4_9_14_3_um_filter_59_35]|nr:MAG: type I-C CRISPR-associated protein Cas8c/Csd1 [Hydrogenophilales bacterium CG18_big_fil_WC_8_21_14_2_50_58_12]PIX98608.1 MAG: type I-C CRISPR-associated protein Cas8c/Csd1 [Hydrogenophilales bacterium CG_4_10_14_3_um_filter_58_23]PJB04975.1 MAG: type I-C CRISPR-associated protein Cas8c/Csd1 [Hydrogenophilales bacterium CG_4_9_14_3_um_filter_59_35]